MTIYQEITAQNSCALKPKKTYITQREKIKDFHDLAEFTFRRRSRLWKPSTLRVNRDYLKNQILPFFKTRAIASISRDDVATWFAGLSHMPEGANRAVPVLSAIMVEAEELGLRPLDSNPTLGLRRYKRTERGRVLTQTEMARLGAVLKSKERRQPLAAAVLRLIILTGCRKGEIMSLRWRDYRDGHLHLADSKTGPKMVFLSAPARQVLAQVKTKNCRYIFPARNRRKPINCINAFWNAVREDARITDMRLHDFRHHYASIAIRHGESLTTIGRLLGHQQPASTLRYAHFDDGMMHQAVEKITADMTARTGTKAGAKAGARS